MDWQVAVGPSDGRRKRTKHHFTPAERFGAWFAHDRKCQLCRQPVEYLDLEIDHYFPERLQDDAKALAQIIEDFALPEDFDLNSFSNWVPAHRHHNRAKGTAIPKWSPNEQAVVRRNIAKASAAAKAAQRFRSDLPRGRILLQVLAALETRALTIRDLMDLVDDLLVDPARRHLPDGTVFLDDGRMFAGHEIVKIGICQCERSTCVGHETKINCIFTTEQSEWVVSTGLYHACYDELVLCPRCDARHRRGYIGRTGSCSAPFVDQVDLVD